MARHSRSRRHACSPARASRRWRRARIDLAQHDVVRWPLLFRLLRARPSTTHRWEQLDRYTTALVGGLPRDIAHVTGARAVVDSSRLPIEPVALGLVPGVDVRLAQVVRDPRAVVYSWKRSKKTTDRDNVEYMPKFSAAFSTASWLARNLVVEVIGRRRTVEVVHYDEMARDPAAVLRRLATFVGEPAGELEFLTSETATIAPTHSVGGNPVRMTSGAITIKPDEEWRGDIRRVTAPSARAIVLPLLHRYGLPVRSAEEAARPTLTTNAWLRFDTIRRDLRTAKPETVLEVGAGEGGLGSWLASHFTYTGVEPDVTSRGRRRSVGLAPGSRPDRRVARRGRRSAVRRRLRVRGARAHRRGPKALEQWREYLRPSGWLLLSVPAHQDHYGAADELVGHYRRYEQSTLTGVLNDAGFEVVHLSSYGAGLGQVLQRGRNAAREARRRRSESTERTRRRNARRAADGSCSRGRRRSRSCARRSPHPGAWRSVRSRRPTSEPDTSCSPVARSDAPPRPRDRHVRSDDASIPPMAAAPRTARRRGRGPQRRLLGRRSRRGRFAGPDAAARARWIVARRAHLATCEQPDVVVFLYPGHLDACVLGPIAGSAGSPAVLDVFISLYDTVIVDRGLRSPRSPVAFATRALDVLACWSVPMVVVDTPEHADFFAAFTHRAREALRGAVGGRRGITVRGRAGSRRRRVHPLVSHLHPFARLRNRRAAGRCSPATVAGSA